MSSSSSQQTLYIGTMSGTSMDGLDLVAVEFGSAGVPLLISSAQVDYPGTLQKALMELAINPQAQVTQMCSADTRLGRFYADEINRFISDKGIDKTRIHAIGSHGQTIRHMTEGDSPYSLQIGDPNIIAAQTGLTVVADFRRRDIALGGQGAPFAPAFHNQVFRSTKADRVIINIGGIANITWLPKDSNQPVRGFDTGPGNTLLDTLSRDKLGQPYDEDGKLARTGKVLTEPLRSIMASEPYFAKPPPKSTGTDYFSPSWLARTGLNDEASADAMATLVELTCVSISDAIRSLPYTIAEAYACGGGAHNSYLMQRLAAMLGTIPLASTESLGVPPDHVEAMAFAWLARQTMLKKPANLPSVTNAENFTILGGVYY